MIRQIRYAAGITFALAATLASGALPAPSRGGLAFTIAASQAEFRPGDSVSVTMTLKNTSGEKLRILRYDEPRRELVAPDADSLATGFCLARDMMPPTLANFHEVEPGGSLTWTNQVFEGNPPRIFMPLDGMSYSIYLLKPGVYKLSSVYANQMDTYWPGKKPNERLPVPGKVWKGEIKSNTLELKVTGDFKAPPPADRPMWPPQGIAPLQKGQPQPVALPGAPKSAPGTEWTEVFAKEGWYKQQPGEEGSFRGRLQAVKPQGETTLMRSASYRLGNRTLYTGAGKHPALDALVGKPVEIRGKAVDMQLEGQAVREIWPAAIRISAPIPEGSLRPEPMPAPAPGTI